MWRAHIPKHFEFCAFLESAPRHAQKLQTALLILVWYLSEIPIRGGHPSELQRGGGMGMEGAPPEKELEDT